jgi:hypothetical protein
MTRGSLDDQKRLVSIKGARVAPSSTEGDLRPNPSNKRSGEWQGRKARYEKDLKWELINERDYMYRDNSYVGWMWPCNIGSTNC